MVDKKLPIWLAVAALVLSVVFAVNAYDSDTDSDDDADRVIYQPLCSDICYDPDSPAASNQACYECCLHKEKTEDYNWVGDQCACCFPDINSPLKFPHCFPRRF